MTRQERRKRRRQRRRRMQAGILLSLVLVLGLIIALRAGKERETLEQEIPLAAERQTLAYIAPAPALPDTAAEDTVYFSTAPYNESVDMIIGNHYFCKIF